MLHGRPLVCFLVTFLLSFHLRAQDGTGEQAAQELIFPMVHSAFLDGSKSLQTVFSILNLTNSSAQAAIVAYQDDGSPIRVLGLCSPDGLPPDPDEVVLNFELSAGGWRDFLTQEDNRGELPGFSGWAKVSLDRSLNIQASSEIRLRTTPEPCIVLSGLFPAGSDPGRPEAERFDLFLNAGQVLAVQQAVEFRGRAYNSVSRRSGFSIVNPSESVSAQVALEVFNLLGQKIGSAEIEVPPLHRVSRFVGELVPVRPCPECPTVHYEGSIVISSDVPIAVGGLVVLEPDGLWVSLPLESPD